MGFDVFQQHAPGIAQLAFARKTTRVVPAEFGAITPAQVLPAAKAAFRRKIGFKTGESIPQLRLLNLYQRIFENVSQFPFREHEKIAGVYIAVVLHNQV